MDKPQKNINPDRPPQFFLNRDQILTLNDFLDFKAQLLYEIRQLVKEVTGRPIKQWLKSHEVKNCLNLDERPTDHAEQWYNPVYQGGRGCLL